MRRLLLAAFLVLASASLGLAQYDQDFDTLVGSDSGVLLTGQDFYYVPVSGSTDFYVYTYAGNSLGYNTNPLGGTQFAAGTSNGGTAFARAQRDIIFGANTGVWRIQYDGAALYLADPPATNNIGSLSLRTADAAQANIHLFSYADPNVPTSWQALYLAFDAAGVQFAQPGASPGPQWENLPLNNWYRFNLVINLDANTVTEVSIQDLTGGGSPTVYNPTDWYLPGGTSGPIYGPFINFRLFTGGSTFGNTMAYDNIHMFEDVAQPTGACCFADGSCRVTTQDECTAAGGTQWIEGGVCQPNPCPPPVPVEETSWGRVKNAFK